MTILQEAVLKIVRLVPPGKVVSYGQVAAYMGAPRAARQVGWIMRSLAKTADFPWWRVLNNAGKITIKGHYLDAAKLQKDLLLAENIEVNDDFSLDMLHYRFKPNAVQLKTLALPKEYLEDVLKKYEMI